MALRGYLLGLTFKQYKTLKASESKVNLSKAVVVWGKLPPAFNMGLLCFILPFMAEVRGQVSSCWEDRREEGQGAWKVEEIVRTLGQIRTTVFIPGWSGLIHIQPHRQAGKEKGV